MIAALAENGVIGSESGGIPWHLPRDTAHFRRFTEGKHLLLGRRTFEEMRGWFTNQTPLVLSHGKSGVFPPGVHVHGIEEAISEAARRGAPELAVCGGASVYEAALPYTDELFLTRIEASPGGDIIFPDYEDGIEWEEVHRANFPADAENEFAMTFLQLRRRHPSSLRPPRLHLL